LAVAQGEGTVWAWLSGRGALERREVEGALSSGPLPRGASIAIGEPARGLEGWRLTPSQAQRALAVALREPRRVTWHIDVALLAAAIKDDTLASSLLAAYLQP